MGVEVGTKSDRFRKLRASGAVVGLTGILTYAFLTDVGNSDSSKDLVTPNSTSMIKVVFDDFECSEKLYVIPEDTRSLIYQNQQTNATPVDVQVFSSPAVVSETPQAC